MLFCNALMSWCSQCDSVVLLACVSPMSQLAPVCPLCLSLGLRQEVQASILIQGKNMNIRDGHSPVCSVASCHFKRNRPCWVPNQPPSEPRQDLELGTGSIGTLSILCATETCLHASLIRSSASYEELGPSKPQCGVLLVLWELKSQSPLEAPLPGSRSVSPYVCNFADWGPFRQRGLQL